MNTNKKILVKEDKVLKLDNVLIRRINENELNTIDDVTNSMIDYIKSKNNTTVGPIIYYAGVQVDQKGEGKIKSEIMIQLKDIMYDVDESYEIRSEIRVYNCLFARFIENERYLQRAYEKLVVHAFEEDLKLKGDYYTIYVNKEEDKIVVDIFMECEKGGDLLESI